jgi:hypothetical protein
VNDFRIVRVSIYVETSPAVKDELRRVVGEPGTLVNLDATKARTQEQLLDTIRRRDPDAIFIDGPVPPNTQAVRELASEYPIVEMNRELVPSRDPNRPAGVYEQRLVLRDETGRLTPLRDGQLREEIIRQRERRDIGYGY